MAAARVRLYLAQGEVGLAVRVLSRDGWQIEGQQALPFKHLPARYSTGAIWMSAPWGWGAGLSAARRTIRTIMLGGER